MAVSPVTTSNHTVDETGVSSRTRETCRYLFVKWLISGKRARPKPTHPSTHHSSTTFNLNFTSTVETMLLATTTTTTTTTHPHRLSLLLIHFILPFHPLPSFPAFSIRLLSQPRAFPADPTIYHIGPCDKRKMAVIHAQNVNACTGDGLALTLTPASVMAGSSSLLRRLLFIFQRFASFFNPFIVLLLLLFHVVFQCYCLFVCYCPSSFFRGVFCIFYQSPFRPLSFS